MDAARFLALIGGAFIGILLAVSRSAEDAVPQTARDASRNSSSDLDRPLPLATLSRAQILAYAKEAVSHRWTCRGENARNSCIGPRYRSDWRPGEHVTGIPYNWGGIDSPRTFQAKLERGYAAGAHSWDGINRCSTGMDCSGFVSYCWGVRDSHAYSTSTLYRIARNVPIDPYTDLKPGDALVNRARMSCCSPHTGTTARPSSTKLPELLDGRY